MRTLQSIPPYRPKVVVTTFDGRRYVFSSALYAARALGRRNLLRWIVDSTSRSTSLRNEFGDPVESRTLLQLLGPYCRPGRGRRDYPNPRMLGSGRYRGSYRGHRRPRTFPEHRWVRGWQADSRRSEWPDETPCPAMPRANIRIRGRRRPGHLPSAWDDLPRRNARHASWKDQRRHQWRA